MDLFDESVFANLRLTEFDIRKDIRAHELSTLKWIKERRPKPYTWQRGMRDIPPITRRLVYRRAQGNAALETAATMAKSILKGEPVILREMIRNASRPCECCAEHDVLELHHMHYRFVGDELPCDLAALCRDCHQKQHTDLDGRFWSDPELMVASIPKDRLPEWTRKYWH